MKGRLMTATEQDIYSTPAILRQTLARVDERSDVLAPWLQGPAVFLGCGSSYCIALAAAALYEDARGVPAQGIMASEYHPRPEWTHVAISRTGQTSELVEAMRRARAAGARVALVGGELGAPAQQQADAVLRRTGATVRCTDDDPLVVAAQAQLLAVRMAEARRVDPDAPRHLRRAIVLPSTQ